MPLSPKAQYNEEQKEYLETRLEPLIADLATQVLYEQPENPIPLMIRWCAAQSQSIYAPLEEAEAQRLRDELRLLSAEVVDLEAKLRMVGTPCSRDLRANGHVQEEEEMEDENEEDEFEEQARRDIAEPVPETSAEDAWNQLFGQPDSSEKPASAEDVVEEDMSVEAEPPRLASEVRLDKYIERGPRGSVSAEAHGDWNNEMWEIHLRKKPDNRLETLTSAMKHICIFREMEQAEIEVFARAMVEQYAIAGERIVNEGEAAKVMYAIEQGSVNMLQMIDGQETTVKQCGPGEVFNEIALLHNCLCTTTVEAQDVTRLWLLERDMFTSIATDHASKRRAKMMSFLQTVPLLENFDADALSQLADSLQREDFEAGTIIYQQGDEARKFYFVETGQLVAQRMTVDGQWHVAFAFARGDFFGDLALFHSKAGDGDIGLACRPVTVVAATDARLLWIERSSLETMVGPVDEWEKTLQARAPLPAH